MPFRVLFFGATADETGKRSIEFPLESGVQVQTALEEVLNKFQNLRKHKLLVAVNQEYVSVEKELRDGDELAIFTAVSGG
jgi:molybdopterin synthase sulfur carrier subunit